MRLHPRTKTLLVGAAFALIPCRSALAFIWFLPMIPPWHPIPDGPAMAFNADVNFSTTATSGVGMGQLAVLLPSDWAVNSLAVTVPPGGDPVLFGATELTFAPSQMAADRAGAFFAAPAQQTWIGLETPLLDFTFTQPSLVASLVVELGVGNLPIDEISFYTSDTIGTHETLVTFPVVPEPSMFALVNLAGITLLMFRHR